MKFTDLFCKCYACIFLTVKLLKVAHYPPYNVFAMRKSDAFVDVGLLLDIN